MDVRKVSLVDEPANLREFLLIKQKGNATMDMTIEEIEGLEIDPETLEALFDPEIYKALDPKVAKVVAAAVARLQKVKGQLSKGLQSAVDRLAAAVGGKEKTDYPPPKPNPVKKNLDGDTPEWAQALMKRLDGVEEHLGIAPGQQISVAEAEKVAREMYEKGLEDARKGGGE